MQRLRRFVRGHVLDLLVVLAAVEASVEVVIRRNAEDAPTTTLWFTVPATAATILPLLARRRFPFGAPAAVWLLGATFSFVDGRLVVFTTSLYLAGMVAAFLLGGLRDPLEGPLGLAVVLGGAATVVYNKPHTPGELVFTPLLFAIGWLAGFVLRQRSDEAEEAVERAASAERERDAVARLAVAEERARIARELHDIVAHAMSVMVLQVGAVRHRLPGELDDDAEALRGVEQTGRSALAEMRRLLGAMRADGDRVELAPRPGLRGLDALLDEVGRAGLPVELHVDGQAVALPPGIDLSAYRIVQEGLTNALKHARASRADVTVRYRPEELEIEVRDDGDGPASGDGLGHGLVGVRERVKVYGGEMTAGAVDGRGFVLRTRFPLEGERR